MKGSGSRQGDRQKNYDDFRQILQRIKIQHWKTRIPKIKPLAQCTLYSTPLFYGPSIFAASKATVLMDVMTYRLFATLPLRRDTTLQSKMKRIILVFQQIHSKGKSNSVRIGFGPAMKMLRRFKRYLTTYM